MTWDEREIAAGQDNSDLGGEPRHPHDCVNGWLSEDVECPGCVANHEEEQALEEAREDRRRAA